MSIKEFRTERYYTVYKKVRFMNKSAGIFLLIPFGAISLVGNTSAFLSFYLTLKKDFATLLRITVIDRSFRQRL
jgi:hypothetical protein